MNREAWLGLLLDAVRPRFADNGFPVPDKVRVSCSFPSRSALSAKRRRIGECWHPKHSKDGTTEIFVSPLEASSEQVTETLVHEAAHAAVKCEGGHRNPWKKCAKLVGLDGKASGGKIDGLLQGILRSHVAKHGEYPHAPLDAVASHRKKQGTRMLKCECEACGYTCRTTQKWLDAAGAPLCPTDRRSMRVNAQSDGGDEEES